MYILLGFIEEKSLALAKQLDQPDFEASDC